MTGATTENGTLIGVEATSKAFENMLIVQGEIQQELFKAGDNSVAMQVAKVNGLRRLQDAFDEAAMPAILAIAGTAIGFKTDQDIEGGGTKYPPMLVRDVVIQAMLSGLEVIGNQFNIISKGLFITKEGYEHLLAHHDAVSNMDVTIGNPEDCDIQQAPSAQGNYTVFTVYGYVPVVIQCRIFGHPFIQSAIRTDQLDGRLQVSASGKDKLKCVDSLKSKAKRRAMERLHEFVQTARDQAAHWDDPPKVLPPANVETTGGETVHITMEPDDPPAVIDWAAEFERRNVITQGRLLRDAPTAADRQSVLNAAKSQVGKEIDQRAYETLERYAKSKDEPLAR